MFQIIHARFLFKTLISLKIYKELINLMHQKLRKEKSYLTKKREIFMNLKPNYLKGNLKSKIQRKEQRVNLRKFRLKSMKLAKI